MKTTLITIGLMLIASAAMAKDIYKYTDENGTVHYVDRPTGAPTEERVAFVSQGSSTSAPRGEDAGPDWRERRQARQDEQQAEEDAAAEQAEQARVCQQYRDRLASYNESRRLYRENEQGEREYLDDAQVEEAKQRVADLIRENCS